MSASFFIYGFRNGDVHDEGTRLHINPRAIPDLDRLLEHCSREVGCVTGPVRKIVTPAGRRIRSLDQLEDGMHVVCCGGEGLNKERMSRHIRLEGSERPSIKAVVPEQAPARPKAKSKRRPVVEPGTLGATKFGQVGDRPRIILAFRNGDRHHTGERITMNMKRLGNWAQFLQHLTDTVRPVTGAIRKLYLPDGTRIRTFEDIEDGMKIVCCGGEALNQDRMPTAALQ